MTMIVRSNELNKKFYRKVTFVLRPIIIFIDSDEDRKGPWEILAIDRAF